MNKKRLGEHLEKLATFKLVADLKSVHKASSRLGLSQPAVSRTIKVLEDVLECQLMERKSRGIQLTEDGNRLYEYAQMISVTLENFNPKGDIKEASSRIFRIATYDNIACGILSEIGPAFTSEFSQISISVEGTNSKILGDLIAGKTDCAIIAQPRVLPGIEYRKLFTEKYSLFIGRKLFTKNKMKKQMPLEDLKKFRLIAMPEAIAGANKNIDRLLWETGLQSMFSIDSYEVALRLVLDSHGIGILPSSSVSWALHENLIEELSIKGVPSTFGPHDITLCWGSQNAHPQMALFEKILSRKYAQI